jgi:hypothetical protein
VAGPSRGGVWGRFEVELWVSMLFYFAGTEAKAWERQVWVAAAEPFFYASVVGGGKWSSLFFFFLVLESHKRMG